MIDTSNLTAPTAPAAPGAPAPTNQPSDAMRQQMLMALMKNQSVGPAKRGPALGNILAGALSGYMAGGGKFGGGQPSPWVGGGFQSGNQGMGD